MNRTSTILITSFILSTLVPATAQADITAPVPLDIQWGGRGQAMEEWRGGYSESLWPINAHVEYYPPDPRVDLPFYLWADATFPCPGGDVALDAGAGVLFGPGFSLCAWSSIDAGCTIMVGTSEEHPLGASVPIDFEAIMRYAGGDYSWTFDVWRDDPQQVLLSLNPGLIEGSVNAFAGETLNCGLDAFCIVDGYAPGYGMGELWSGVRFNIPEPTSAAIALLGLAALLLRRRRTYA